MTTSIFTPSNETVATAHVSCAPKKSLDRSAIFKNAWKLVKECGLKLSAALKSAWATAKGLVVTTPAKVYFGITGGVERKLDEFKAYCDANGANYKEVLTQQYESEDAADVFFAKQVSEYCDGFYAAESATEYSKNNINPMSLVEKALEAFHNYRTLTGKIYQF